MVVGSRFRPGARVRWSMGRLAAAYSVRWLGYLLNYTEGVRDHGSACRLYSARLLREALVGEAGTPSGRTDFAVGAELLGRLRHRARVGEIPVREMPAERTDRARTALGLGAYCLSALRTYGLALTGRL